MATRLEDEFDPSRINAPNAAYPAGSLKDETTPGVSDDGTPLASRVGNDWQGFSQSVLDKAGIAANGQPDSVSNPQILQSIEQMYNDGDSQQSGGNIWPLSSQDNISTTPPLNSIPNGTKFVRYNDGGEIRKYTLSSVLTSNKTISAIDEINGVITFTDTSKVDFYREGIEPSIEEMLLNSTYRLKSRIKTGLTTFLVVSSVTGFLLPNGLYARPLNGVHFNDYESDNDAALALAVTHIKDNTSLVFSGDYTFNVEPGVFSGDGIHLVGQGSTINWTSTTNDEVLFRVNEKSRSSTTISSSYQEGLGSVYLADVSNVTNDSLISVKSNTSWYTNAANNRDNKKGELCIVDSVTGGGSTEVVVNGKMLFSYVVGSPVDVIQPSRDCVIEGFNVYGTGSENITSFSFFTGCHNACVKDCSVYSMHSGFGCQESLNMTITNIHSNDVDKPLGYTVAIGINNINTTVSNSDGSKCRHFVTTTGEAGVSKNTNIIGNTIRGSIFGAIDTHVEGYATSIIGNVLIDCKSGINVRSPWTVVRGNTLLNCGYAPNNTDVTSNVTNASAIITNELGWINLQISDNTIKNDYDRYGSGAGPGGPTGAIPYDTFGSGIDIRGATNDLGYNEFEPEFIEVSRNNSSGFRNGNDITINVSIFPGLLGSLRINVDNNDLSAVSGFNTIWIRGVKGEVDVSVTGNKTNVPTRNTEYPIVVNGFNDLTMTKNEYRQFARTPVVCEEGVNALIVGELKPYAGSASALNGFIPTFTNVDTYNTEANGNGFQNEDISLPIGGDDLYTLELYQPADSRYSQYKINRANQSELEVASTSAGVHLVPSIAANGVISVTGANSTWYWKLYPVYNFTG